MTIRVTVTRHWAEASDEFAVRVWDTLNKAGVPVDAPNPFCDDVPGVTSGRLEWVKRFNETVSANVFLFIWTPDPVNDPNVIDVEARWLPDPPKQLT